MPGTIKNFQDILDKCRAQSFSERDKGARFERLMQAFLKTYPVYKGKFADIWLWSEFPHRDAFGGGGKDTGIDLVARTVEGEFWAIQCKCWDESSTINKPALDTFLSTSGKSFEDDEGRTVSFALRLWISTTNKWGAEAENAIKNQNPRVIRISLTDLENAQIDWAALEKGISGEGARLSRKTPRRHQMDALEACHRHFLEGDRGKLIMACGTGKTFTALKIAENETKEKVDKKPGAVLFLVPSIALLGQTLREWMAEAERPIYPICVCSDPEVSKRKAKKDEGDEDIFGVEDLALPASTFVPNIVKQFSDALKTQKDGMIVIFSTYQSIEVVSRTQRELKIPFDLVVCDEAHRTTGVTLKNEEDAAFVKVHDDHFIAAKKRLYMTATPRLYRDDTKRKAREAEAYLCSMDDEAIYGPEMYRIGFGQAVDEELLSDYKVLVLTMNAAQVPEALQNAIADKNQEIDTNDAGKLIGCINALSKRMLVDEGLLRLSDPSPMHRAVAFCQSIKISKKTTSIFNNYKDDYYNSLTAAEREDVVGVQADHVDGTMGAATRDAKLSWLKSAPAELNECRILTNVRCLSEGVDVPSLDAVMFLSARNSEIDVVQSVGRVMRRAPGKKYGYIIIPVVIPSDVSPEEVMEDNERFKVVWTVLNALRAHDDRFESMVNKIELNKRKPCDGGSVLVGGIASGNETWDGDGSRPSGAVGEGSVRDGTGKGKAWQFLLPLQDVRELQYIIYARMVQKVGNKRYWEQWAQDVAQIAQNYIERINRLIALEGKHKEAFGSFLTGLRKNINPAVREGEVVEMLAQHLITKPVFEALFENYSFVKHNPVSQSLQKMIDLLEEQAMEKDVIVLSRFYESVRRSVSKIDNAEGRQKVIVELYDKFFRTAFPKTVEKLGIVYTPVEIVEFINQSVATVLHSEFGRDISDEDVHILDPFTGTGTFIARLIQSNLIDKTALARKYARELHANEIVLLAYYIASINIENAFHGVMGEEAEYRPFDGICLTDTFQLEESDDESKLFTDMLPQNSERAIAQKQAPIMIIVGNPPYSVGQRSANDNAQNQSYPKLEKRIAETYAAQSTATLKNSLYDSYIKAFRWASDRLDDKRGGIIAFVSNAGWIDGNAMDGFRKCLEKEFSAIYVFNLRGNCRTLGEARRKEAGNIFGLGSRTPIAITLLVKKPDYEGKAAIYYRDIGDYLSREEKLAIVAKSGDVLNSGMNWTVLKSNKNGDWIAQRNDTFSSFIPMGDKGNKDNSKTVFAAYYSNGLKTNRDAWVYNYSVTCLIQNMQEMIDFYNEQRKRYQAARLKKTGLRIDDYIDTTPSKISWTVNLKSYANADKDIGKEHFSLWPCIYRPFTKQFLYFQREFIERPGLWGQIFPTPKQQNKVICISANTNGLPLMADIIPDLHFNGDAQCFPLYWYERREQGQTVLFKEEGDEYIRRDGVTDFILNECRARYAPKVTKEDIFYYVYGLLHSPEYRERFAADLKKMLPRLPLPEKPADFWGFSKAGRELADLHLNYESAVPYPDVIVTGVESGNFCVEKMRFTTKDDKSTIQFNAQIRIENIPLEAYDYIVNGKSAIEWIMERYQVKIDKDSHIKNDPNDWAAEHDKPRYILDLLLSVITVSLETVKVVEGLPGVGGNHHE